MHYANMDLVYQKLSYIELFIVRIFSTFHFQCQSYILTKAISWIQLYTILR